MGRSVELKCAKSARQTAVVATEGGGAGATVRYDDEKNIRVNDRLILVDADTGEHIVEARVNHVNVTPAYSALDVIKAHGAVYGTQYVTHLIENLNEYYDDVSPLDDVKVVIYDPYPTTLGTDR